MTMIARAPHHFQVMCSGSIAVDTRVREPVFSPAQVPLTESKPKVRDLKESANEASRSSQESTSTSLAFVYGTLKRGFGNHWLMEDQMSTKHCRLVGTAQTKNKFPLVCGPFQVPFLLNVPGSGEHVRGELYQVDNHCMKLLDELEGTSKGHYVRCPVSLNGIELDASFTCSRESLDGVSLNEHHSLLDSIKRLGEVQAEAYFAASHYTPGLYRAPHIVAYTEKESATYTRRIHRPQHRTFIEHVYHWIEEQKLVSAVEK